MRRGPGVWRGAPTAPPPAACRAPRSSRAASTPAPGRERARANANAQKINPLHEPKIPTLTSPRGGRETAPGAPRRSRQFCPGARKLPYKSVLSMCSYACAIHGRNGWNTVDDKNETRRLLQAHAPRAHRPGLPPPPPPPGFPRPFLLPHARAPALRARRRRVAGGCAADPPPPLSLAPPRAAAPCEPCSSGVNHQRAACVAGPDP